MLIGLTGRAGSGKDTVYRTLYALFNDVRPVVRLAFADTLKHSALASLKDFGEHWEDVAERIKQDGVISIEVGDEKLVEISGREFFQRYGTEAHRSVFGEDFWVDALLPPLEPLDFGPFLHSPEIYVVTDVRYDNEASRIREYGGFIWLIDRPGEEIDESEHASEAPISEELVDFVLPNDGDLEELKNHIAKSIIASLMEKQRDEEEIRAVSENATKTYEKLQEAFGEQGGGAHE